MKFGIGCDPEFFLWDKDSNMYVSAHSYLPGTKKEPFKLDKGAVQVDGTAVEFNIDPAYEMEEFVDNIDTVLKQVRKMVPKNLSFSFVPEVLFEQNYFRDEIPSESKELGCDPDMDAYTGKLIEIFNKEKASQTPYRTAGGHIHLSWRDDGDLNDKDHIFDAKAVARIFDHIHEKHVEAWEPYNDRRNVYGKKGAIRIKKYGVEYRSPSNAWLRNKNYWKLMYSYASATMHCAENGITRPNFAKLYVDDTNRLKNDYIIVALLPYLNPKSKEYCFIKNGVFGKTKDLVL